MTAISQGLVRRFKVGGVTLDDPMPGGSLEEVRQHLSAAFPDVTTADIEGPELAGGKLLYEFRRAYGTKG